MVGKSYMGTSKAVHGIAVVNVPPHWISVDSRNVAPEETNCTQGLFLKLWNFLQHKQRVNGTNIQNSIHSQLN
jgi:hypothetical protein